MTTTNNAIMTTIKENAKTTGRAAILATLKGQLAEANELNQKFREERVQELKNNTVIMSVVASRGYVGIVAGDIAETIVEPATVKKAIGKDGTKFSAPTTTLIGAHYALKQAGKYGKENLVLYVNDNEVARICGMLNRISNGSKEILTSEEVKHLTKAENMKRYGTPYLQQAKALYSALVEAHNQFKSVRVMGHDSIFGWALKNSNVPLDLEGAKVKFTKGIASTTFKGRNYTFTLASGFKLNGEFELVKSNSRLVVGREIKEGSEQETARDLLSIVNQTIILTDLNDKNSTGSFPEEADGQAEAFELAA